MKSSFRKALQKEGFANLVSAILAILLGLLFGLIILLISNPENAWGGFLAMLTGSLANEGGIDTMFYMATPVIMTALSVGFAFKLGLFNIGVAGQFTMGALAAIWVGVKWTFVPAPIHWLVAILIAMVAGAIWGFIPGMLKAFLNVNEVIATIMLNYIGMFFANMMVYKYMYDDLKNQSVPVMSSANLPKWFLDDLFPGTKMTIGIIIAIALAIVVYIILNKTTFGYEIQACGKNKDAAQYAGINAKRNIVLSMVIAGALAGIGGALLYLSGAGRYWQVLDVLAPEGFTGLAVALLGGSNPIGIIFAGLFVEHLTLGGLNMQLYDFAPEVIDMIIAVIIYCGALSLLFKMLLGRWAARLGKGDNE